MTTVVTAGSLGSRRENLGGKIQESSRIGRYKNVEQQIALKLDLFHIREGEF